MQSVRQPARMRLLIVIFVLATITLGAFQAYRYRCRVLECPPASWPAIQALINNKLAEAGQYAPSPYLIRVSPSKNTIFTDNGPVTIDIEVECISRVPEPDHPQTLPVTEIVFNDQDLWVTWKQTGGGIGIEALPRLDQARQHFVTVRIHPREVYGMTWQQAQDQLAEAFEPEEATMRLYLYDLDEQFRAPLWVISYDSFTGNLKRVTFFVDAQTGTILMQGVESFGEANSLPS